MNKSAKLLSLMLSASLASQMISGVNINATKDSITFYDVKNNILDLKEYDAELDTNHDGNMNVFDVIRANKTLIQEESYTDLKEKVYMLETQIESLYQKLNEKTDTEEGKQLSSNDYTDEEKKKLESLNNYDDSKIKTEVSELSGTLSGKVDKEEGKQLSSNDYTDEEKHKLESLNNYDDSKIKTEVSELSGTLSGKVDKEEGKQLSSNDYTDEEKHKLESLNNYDDTNIKTEIQNQNNLIDSLVDIANKEKNKYDNILSEIEKNKVDKEEGKQLSSNDYTDEDKQKLESLRNYDDIVANARTPKDIISDALINNKTIKFLGDSITAGVGGRGYFEPYGDGEDIVTSGKITYKVNESGYCFANLFKSYIQSKYGNTVLNFGTRGIRTYDIVSWIDNGTYVTNEDKLLIIMIGTNNKWATDNTTIDDLKGDLQKIIDWCKNNDKDLILITDPASSVEKDTYYQDGTEVKFHNEDIDHAFNEVCYNNNIAYISMYQKILEYCDLRNITIDSILSDGLHPNDDGYYIMYKILMREFGIAYQLPNSNWDNASPD